MSESTTSGRSGSRLNMNVLCEGCAKVSIGRNRIFVVHAAMPNLRLWCLVMGMNVRIRGMHSNSSIPKLRCLDVIKSSRCLNVLCDPRANFGLGTDKLLHAHGVVAVA